MSISELRLLYPEFDEAADALVQDKLDEAASGLYSGAFGSRYDEAHGLLTAHSLAMSPFGRALRQEDDKETAYEVRLKQVRREAIPRIIAP